MLKKVILFSALFLLAADQAWAIQEHSGVEAYYVHQIAHVFFIVSMAVLMDVLKRPFAAKGTGWPRIRFSAFLFILWNIVAFVGHYAAERMEPKGYYIVGSELMLRDLPAKVYYLAGLSENFFLSGAFVFLALGLGSLWRRMKEEA